MAPLSPKPNISPQSPHRSGQYPFKQSAPKGLRRLGIAGLLGGQVLLRLLKGKLQRRNLMEHLIKVGPNAIGAVLLINGFAGMIFTVQTAREMSRLGALDAVGGAFAMAFCRELAPVLTAGVVAGQVGAAFAAELGAMRVTEQIDALLMMRTDPVDYLVVPRVVATCVMLPILTLFAIAAGMLGGTAIAYQAYGQLPGTFLGAANSFLTLDDLFAVLLKALVFGLIVSVVGCSWGLTTWGGAKGVGESATSAVVMIWIGVFMADFVLSLWLFGTLPT